MAFSKRRTFRRRRYRPRTYIPRIDGETRRERVRALSRTFMGPTGTRYFKIRTTEGVSSDAGGIITFGMNNNPSSYQDWSSISSLFDSFKVVGMKIQFIPDKPNDTSTITGYSPLYVIADPDSATNPLTSVNMAIEYENMKVVNMYRPWKYYYKPPKITSTGGSSIVLAGGYRDMASPAGTSGIWTYGFGFDISDNYGIIVKTLYVACRNRR